MREGSRRQAAGSDRGDADAHRGWTGPDIRSAIPDKTIEYLKPGGIARLDLNHVGPAQLLRVNASPLRIARAGDRGRATPKGAGAPARPGGAP